MSLPPSLSRLITKAAALMLLRVLCVVVGLAVLPVVCWCMHWRLGAVALAVVLYVEMRGFWVRPVARKPQN